MFIKAEQRMLNNIKEYKMKDNYHLNLVTDEYIM